MSSKKNYGIQDNNPNREPRLLGIARSNRAHANMWGKNCFNSAFPAALACYMRDHKINPVYVCLEEVGGEIQCINREISMDDVFNVQASIRNEDLCFSFETKFKPYLGYVRDETQLDGVDLVIMHQKKWLRALQVKLTVVPDSSTKKKEMAEWGAELVFRPADTCSCALGIFDGIANCATEIVDMLRVPCFSIQDWNNKAEINQHRSNLLICAKKFLSTFHTKQKPYILQQIWMTEGQSPSLAQNAFDLFIWSDYALIWAYLTQAKLEKEADITRGTRATIRFLRMQYELAHSRQQEINIRTISRGMDFGKQTDKEVAFSGNQSRTYMTSPRSIKPILPPQVLREIILNNGHKRLKPERRFDQTVYFMAAKYFDDIKSP